MDQVLSGHFSGVDVVDKHSSEVLPWHIPVNQNCRNTNVDRSCQSGLGTYARSHNESLDAIAYHGLDKVSQLLRILFRAREDHRKTILIGYVLDIPANLGKEWICNVRHDHGNGMSPSASEGCGGIVTPVAQPLGNLKNPLRRVRVNRTVQPAVRTHFRIHHERNQSH